MASGSEPNLNIQDIVRAVVSDLNAHPAPQPAQNQISSNETISSELYNSFQIPRGGVQRNNQAQISLAQACTQVQSLVSGFNARRNYSTRARPRARRQNRSGSGRFQPYSGQPRSQGLLGHGRGEERRPW